MDMPTGIRINALELTSQESRRREERNGAVTDVWTDTWMTWTCVCGKEKTVWADDLPKTAWMLKLTLTDCGCGAVRPVKRQDFSMPRMGRRRTAISLSLASEVIGGLEEYAQQRGQKISQTAEELLVYAMANKS